MRTRIFMAAAVVTGLACSNNQAKTDETAVKQDSSAQASPGYQEQGRDTSMAGASDSAKSNQTKSGVTDTKTGESTLGKGVTKTRPDQGQPVTSKGDTVGTAGMDSSATGANSGGATNSSDSTGMSAPAADSTDTSGTAR